MKSEVVLIHNDFTFQFFFSNFSIEVLKFYEVIRKVGNKSSKQKVNWEFSNWYSVSGGTRIAYSVIIECDKTSGLKVELRGPFKCLNLEKEPESEVVLTLQKKKKKEPTKEVERKFVESKIEGKEYFL